MLYVIARHLTDKHCKVENTRSITFDETITMAQLTPYYRICLPKLSNMSKLKKLQECQSIQFVREKLTFFDPDHQI